MSRLVSYIPQVERAYSTDFVHPDRSFAADLTGRVMAVTDPAGRKLTYQYDGAGDLVSSTDPAGDTTRYAYDGSHDMVVLTDPNGGKLVRSYVSPTR